MNPTNVISGGLFPFWGSAADMLYHMVVSLVFVIPMGIFLARAGFPRVLATLAFVHVGFVAVLMWFVAFPDGWTPPEDDA